MALITPTGEPRTDAQTLMFANLEIMAPRPRGPRLPPWCCQQQGGSSGRATHDNTHSRWRAVLTRYLGPPPSRACLKTAVRQTCDSTCVTYRWPEALSGKPRALMHSQAASQSAHLLQASLKPGAGALLLLTHVLITAHKKGRPLTHPKEGPIHQQCRSVRPGLP